MLYSFSTSLRKMASNYELYEEYEGRLSRITQAVVDLST